MDLDDSNPGHRRTNTLPQSIPLRDLGDPSDPDSVHLGTPSNHQRTLSERGQRLFTRNGTRNRRADTGNYSPLAGSPANPRRFPWQATPERIPPQSAPQLEEDEEEESSPLDSRAMFSEATVGLALYGDDNVGVGANALPQRQQGRDLLLGSRDSMESFPDIYNDGQNFGLPSSQEDTLPLTENSQPMGVTAPATPSGQRHDRSADRSRSRSVRFSFISHATPGKMLGDDLAIAEAGLPASHRQRASTDSRLRSLSPSSAASPLHRASTMVRKMSQRIVNFTNEPEPIEPAIRRRQSFRHRDSDDPPTPAEDHESLEEPDVTFDGTRSRTGIPSDRAAEVRSHSDWVRTRNPFLGNSLGIFPPDSFLRTWLCDLLIMPVTENIVLFLIIVQTVLLAIDAAPNALNQENPRSDDWAPTWINLAFLALFAIYTVELGVRIIVSGFILNPVKHSTINRQIGWRKALIAWYRALFALHTEQITNETNAGTSEPQQPSIFRTFTGQLPRTDLRGDDRDKRRARLARRAFLRHSFTRLDFLAVGSFWIAFILSVTHFAPNKHVYVFQMMSSLRILRLLGLTSGTTVILRSLKKAAPLLLNVALLIGFFWLLFAIIGVQSFKSSLRRQCVTFVDPVQGNWTLNQYGSWQFCGGSLDASGERWPWYYNDGSKGPNDPKGYLCPPGSLCVSTDNPYSGTVSFDNIFQSLELVFVIMTSNTYTDLMYYLADSDYLVVCLYFAAGIVIMTLWLANLLIAVITSSFQVIREANKKSAFADRPTDQEPATKEDSDIARSPLYQVYEKTYWLWIVIIVYGLVCQSLRSSTMSRSRENFINDSETVVTLLLLFEIILRFAADWRNFHRRRSNWADLSFAVITTIIQIPVIRNSGQPYAWFTFFQIVRIYRVVMAVKWTRVLILLVLGNVSGLLNLILFVVLLTFLASIFASQLFRGEVPQYDSAGNPIHITFATIWNCFIGMYQVLSSENWTTLMYNVTNFDDAYNTAWIGAIFFILWFILSFFIVLNMFIAVIQENFDVSEDEKRIKQVEAFLQRRELGASTNATLSLSALFKPHHFGVRRQDPLDYGGAMMEQLLKGATVQDFVGDNLEVAQDEGISNGANGTNRANGHVDDSKDAGPISVMVESGPLGFIRSRVTKLLGYDDPNPFYSRFKFSHSQKAANPRNMAREVHTAAEQRKRAQKEYLQRHPNYNVSLYIFGPQNKLRRLCQKVVGPGRGAERIDGAAPSTPVWYAFSATLYLLIVAMVLLACITTPVYQKSYFANREYTGLNWFVFADLGFAAVFTIEAIIRVIADGFFFTPHAYFRSSWGLIDGLVLITLWINVLTALFNQGAVSRAVGAFKALRALRLLNVSDSARDTFHAVIVRGGWKVLSAACVSLSLLIPFAIYGVNIFNGRMESCNNWNSGISDLNDCVNEWNSSPYLWNVVAPSQVANPWFNFDNFGNSLFILFSIVSQEGWTDVMWSAEKVTGFYKQPQLNASPGYAVFFIVFNLLGAVFVLTLFISVFMRNYTEQTGVAFLTAEQRSWLELRKRLRQISPSKRPSVAGPRSSWRKWCYQLAVRKTGRWQRLVTAVLMFHLALLCVEFYPVNDTWETVRTYIFLGLTIFYAINIVIRIVGLTWTRFRKSSWDLYSLVAVSGTLFVTVYYLAQPHERGGVTLHSVWQQLHKLFLVSLVLLLIPRNNQLDQLFKTAAASLTAIATLLATWFVLFLVFAIAFTQTFGLTRFNENESNNINFRSVPKALILLFRMSTGEGWNQIMVDFATVVPPYCTEGETFLDSDCGSQEWARALFIAWNILSMYIFVNMFISLIFESFSYVYESSSGLAVVSRQELRRFKQAWAECDPEGTGFIQKESLPRLLGELSGVFEMRIYPQEFTINRLVEDCKIDEPVLRASALPIADDRKQQVKIDLEKLNARLAQMPIKEVQQRRRELNIFYMEILRGANPDKGIPFTLVLMTLAHYKIINDNKNLRLEEFLRRRARLQLVEDEVRRAIVSNFLDTLHWKRKYRMMKQQKNAARMTTIPQLQVPEIYVEDEDDHHGEPSKSSSKPSLTISIPSLNSSAVSMTSGRSAREEMSPGAVLRNRADSFVSNSPHGSPTRTPVSPQQSPQLRARISDVSAQSHLGPGTWDRPPSPLESDEGGTYGRHLGERRPSLGGERARTSSTVSQQGVFEALQDTAWGTSLRRSFTTRRSSGE